MSDANFAIFIFLGILFLVCVIAVFSAWIKLRIEKKLFNTPPRDLWDQERFPNYNQSNFSVLYRSSRFINVNVQVRNFHNKVIGEIEYFGRNANVIQFSIDRKRYTIESCSNNSLTRFSEAQLCAIDESGISTVLGEYSSLVDLTISDGCFEFKDNKSIILKGGIGRVIDRSYELLVSGEQVGLLCYVGLNHVCLLLEDGVLETHEKMFISSICYRRFC